MFSAKKIVITGPESVGKSTLCNRLAEHCGGLCVPEYARSYVEQLSTPYIYADLENIARKQIQQLGSDYEAAQNYVFFDTGLIVTKIWFSEVYGKVPAFLSEALAQLKIHRYLLCYPDIEWIPDKVRENSGENRFRLFQLYENELIKLKQNYIIIRGVGEQRFKNALFALESARSLHNE